MVEETHWFSQQCGATFLWDPAEVAYPPGLPSDGAVRCLTTVILVISEEKPSVEPKASVESEDISNNNYLYNMYNFKVKISIIMQVYFRGQLFIRCLHEFSNSLIFFHSLWVSVRNFVEFPDISVCRINYQLNFCWVNKASS